MGRAGEDSEENNGRETKRRGVRASRTRLEHALANSDLEKKTQIALANRIADLEELEQAPRDLVSRIFREQRVDARSIERVAGALGVPAETLYKAVDDDPASAADGDPPRPRPRRLLVPAVLGLLAVAAGVLIFRELPVVAEARCSLGEWLQTSATPEDRLGVVIAGFPGDRDDVASALLSRSLRSDPALAPYLSVFRSCRRFDPDGVGAIEEREKAIRARARRILQRRDAEALLWGSVRDGKARVRIVSNRSGLASATVGVSGKPIRVEEARVEVPVPLDRPEAALADLKAMMLALMAPDSERRRQLQAEASRSFAISLDWIRASVVSLRNLRRRIDPSLDPRRFAMVANQLCYEERLLGDVDDDVARYRAAERACTDAVEARPKALFPLDWAVARINRASVRIRLHRFAPDRAGALERLAAAREDLEAGGGLLDRHLTPQLWALSRRNLAVLFERLGELGAEGRPGHFFERSVDASAAALEVLNADFQPVDWAITQQNYCLALYQHGIRLGRAGRDRVLEARGRCALALEKLPRSGAPLSWAMVQNNLAVTEAILGDLEQSVDRLRAARSAFTAAQTVYSRDRLPAKWAEVEINLAELACNIHRLGGDERELDIATEHGEGALEVLNDRGIERYRRYTRALLGRIAACRAAGPGNCRCSP
ncbi:MAG: hypothetical protein ACX93N_08860 [Pseudohaliea sp.]